MLQKPQRLPFLSLFVPEIVRALLAQNPKPLASPWSIQFDGAVLRVSISGLSGIVGTFAGRRGDGARLLHQALESLFGERLLVSHAFGASSVLLDGAGMTLVFPAANSPDARFLAGRAALGAALMLRGAGGAGTRGKPGGAAANIEIRMGCHLGPITLGAVGRPWRYLLRGPGVELATAAAEAARNWEVRATEGLLSWVGMVRTEGSFDSGFTSVLALPPPEDRLEPIWIGLRGGDEQLERKVLEAVDPELKADGAEAKKLEGRFEEASVLHACVGELSLDQLHATVEQAAAIAAELGGRLDSIGYAGKAGEGQDWLRLAFRGSAPDSLKNALHAALELRRQLRPAPRIGLARGTLFRTALGGQTRRQLASIGLPHEEAAGWAALALSGQIVLDARDRALMEPHFDFEAEEIRTPAGKQRRAGDNARRTQGRTIHLLLRSREPTSTTTLQAPLIGRAVEVAMGEALVLEAEQGRGGALLFQGEAGMGKTRLLQEIERRVSGRLLRSVSLRCEEGGEPSRLAPLTELLERLEADPERQPPEPPAPAPDEIPALGQRLAQALRRTSEQGVLLIRIDDLHRAHPLARSLALRLGGLLQGLKAALLLAERPVEGPLPESLEALQLEPLPEEEARALIAWVYEGVTPEEPELLRLLAAAGGSPAKLLELDER